MDDTDARVKVSSIPPTTLRFPPELRARLQKEADMNGRSLSREVEVRLRASLAAPDASGGALVAKEDRNAVYNLMRLPDLTDIERSMVAAMRKLPSDKQLALLTLLKV